MAVISDIVEGARWEEDEGLVRRISRIFIITDLVPKQGQAFTADEVFREALDTDGVPAPGDAHPIETNNFVTRRNPSAFGPRIVQIEVIYRDPEAGEPPPPGDTVRVSGSSSVEQIETAIDRANQQITVMHQGVEQGGFIHPFEQRDELTLVWHEQTSNPWVLTRTFTNTVNDGPWAYDPGNQVQARTWHCGPIEFELEEPAAIPPLYRFAASFRRKPEGWDPRVVFIDRETGEPPPDLEIAGLPGDGDWDNAGAKIIPWYAQSTFNNIFP